MKALVVFVGLAACGAQQTSASPAPLPTATASASATSSTSANALEASKCANDSECVVTAIGGCCAVCLEAPYAISRADLEVRHSPCAVVECARPAPPPGGCPTVESPNAYAAACRSGRCQAIKK